MRRSSPRLLCLWVLLLAAVAGCTPSAAEGVERLQARSARAFVDSIGVDVHMYYDDTRYADAPAVVAKLQELGVRHVRDGMVLDRPDFEEALDLLAAAGIRSQLILGSPDDPPDLLERHLARIRERLAPAVEALEGPNEYDLTGGPDWQAKLLPYQERLYDLVKADPVLRDRPVVGPSVKGFDLAAHLDLGNIHPYPGGDPPESGIATELEAARRVSRDKPVQVTETGYHNALNSSGGHVPATEEAAGVYLPRAFLDHFSRGVPRTYAYELLDLKPDPSLSDDQRHFGLLRADLSPKPAFTALRDLIDLLDDPQEVPEPGRLALQVGGDTDRLRQLLLQRSDGRFQLVLWRAVPVYDPETRSAVEAPASTVSLTLDEPADWRATAVSAAPGSSGSGTADVAVDVEVGAVPVVVDLS